VASIGLRALDDLKNHRLADPGRAQSDKQILKGFEKPEAVLRNMIVPPVEMLVEAASQRELKGSGPSTP
jgi:hypothetical protein